ncbi:MAG: choloylglycine hydrolase [Eubacteriales bacterium]|nr:choloylglycine hydrolase [Eubacteriales bacterium]
MCTCVSYVNGSHYFGRNLDLEYSYQESVTITPRNYPMSFRKKGVVSSHYALIGMAFVQDGYPLYYDATNEVGLSMAGLNFPYYAHFEEAKEDEKDNIAPFEFIPWVLSQCKTLAEAKKLLSHLRLINLAYSPNLPLAPLHWMISSKEGSIVVESVKEGLKVYDNPVGVMTNNPPFPLQLFRLNDYRALSSESRENSFSSDLPLEEYSRGMGAIGLPGDLSSSSRFIRASFVKMNSVAKKEEKSSVSQFFHILTSVEQQRGCCKLGKDTYEITIYSSCCNTEKGIYYYRTYDNPTIHALDMHAENLDGSNLASYPLMRDTEITFDNRK